MSDKSLELQIRIAAEEAVRTVSALKDKIKELANESGKYSKNDGEELKKTFKDAEDAAKKSASSIGDIKKALGNLAEVAAATKALSIIKDMGAFALKTADNFQTARNQFGVLLGDMEAGAGLFNEIKAFGDVTPFDLDTLTQATQVLVAAKVPLVDLQDQLTKFGDLSQGNSQKMTSYVNAFSQAAAKGKADMQILNTYLNQGVPILDALANNFGVTTAQIIEMSSKGEISFAAFSQALDDLTAAGGQYFGGMELSSKSLAAMQEGLTEATNTLAASFGEILMPAAIAVIQALTDIANAINECPLLKGFLIGAVVVLTGYLAAMAVKAGIAFAAQMKLNFAIGALNTVVLASTIAVAGLAAGYTIYASNQQKAARETENAALQQHKQRDAIISTTDAIKSFNDALLNMSDANISKNIALINAEIRELQRDIAYYTELSTSNFLKGEIERGRRFGEVAADARRELDIARQHLESAMNIQTERSINWIDSMFGNTQEAKIQRINDQLAIANNYLAGNNLSADDQQKLRIIIRDLNADLDRLTGRMNDIDIGPDIHKMAADWKDAWAEVWGQFQADQNNDLFYKIELDRRKTLDDAHANYIRTLNQETLDQINEYYNAQRNEVIKKLADEERRIQRELSMSRIDDIEYELQETLNAINTLEAQRVVAAGNSEAEIAAIRNRFAQMRENAEIKFNVEIDKTRYEEALEVIWSLENEEKRIQRELNRSRVSALEYELQEALRVINVIEQQRIIASGNSEAEIAAIHERFAQMREDTELRLINEINKTRYEEALEVIWSLENEEKRIQRGLSKSRIDALEYELLEALRVINVLEQQRIIAAGNSEAEIAAIHERFTQMREDTESKFIYEINKTRYEEALQTVWTLADEEARIQKSLSGSKINNLEYELMEALRKINILEEHRVIAAGNSEAEIDAIRRRFAQMREDTIDKFVIEIDKTKLDKARESIKSWQQELSDSLTRMLMNIKDSSDQVSVVIGNLAAQLIELSASAALSGFKEFGKALGQGEKAAEYMSRALAEMSQQILKQLPMMFLQAGLQLIANGQWPLGLGFIAAAGSSAIISGYVDGASKHAQGGVFNEYGQIAQAYAAGGAFTNQIVSTPTYFAHGAGFGLMGEAGPEAIMPLTRMPNGDLGVQATKTGSGSNVVINIINNTNAEVRQEERTDGEGNKQYEIIIGQIVNNHITSGKADNAMKRYGSRPVGV